MKKMFRLCLTFRSIDGQKSYAGTSVLRLLKKLLVLSKYWLMYMDKETKFWDCIYNFTVLARFSAASIKVNQKPGHFVLPIPFSLVLVIILQALSGVHH